MTDINRIRAKAGKAPRANQPVRTSPKMSTYAKKDRHRKLRESAPAVKDPTPRGFERQVTRTYTTKFCDERIGAILDALRRGNYRVVACALAGITYATMTNWMRRGEAALESEDPAEEDLPYADFYEAVLEAEAISEDEILHKVRAQVPDDWRAGMEILRRRHPDRWGRDKVEVTGSDGGPLVVKVVYDDVPIGVSEEDLP